MNTIQKRNLVFLVSGRFISLIGSGIQGVALPLFILDITGSGAMMGIFAMLSMLPTLIMAPIAGVLGDRWNRKRIMVNADITRGIIVFILAILATRGNVGIAVLFVCQVFISILDSTFNSSSDGILPDLIPEEELPRANALKGGMDSAAFIIGPILGGIIYGLWGIKVVFFLNAASFVLSGLCEAMIAYIRQGKHGERLTAKSFINDIMEVINFVMQNKGLKQLFTFAMIINFLITPIFYIIMPFAFKKVIGFTSEQYGFLQTFFMIGLLLGNVIIGSFFAKASSEKLMKTGMYTQTGFMMIFALVMFPVAVNYFGGNSWTFFVVLGAINCLIGAFNPAINIPVQTNLQKMVSSEMRSRFFSVLGLFAQLAVPVGTLVYGLLLDRIQVHIILIAINIVIVCTVILFSFIARREVFEPHLSVAADSE